MGNNMKHKELKVGQYLLFSCSGSKIGPITRVGKDSNGVDVIDVMIPDINEFVNFNGLEDDDEDISYPFNNPLTSIELTGPVKFVDLQYKAVQLYNYNDFFQVNMPAGGCYRCTISCTVVDE